MERLTKTYSDGSFGVADDLPCGENSYDFKNLLIKILGEYEDAEENGLLVRLPCKIGDTVYVIMSYGHVEDALVVDFTHIFLYGFCCILSIGKFKKSTIPFSEFGKTLFLTREEAEVALKNEEKAES